MKTSLKNCSHTLLSTALSPYIDCDKNSYILLAIGTSRVIGDSLAPLVGTMLNGKLKFPIVGTLKSPVTALNIEHYYTCIKLRYPQSKIIALDACIGKKQDIGCVKVFSGGIRPSASTGRAFRKVGDISITAITATCANELSRTPLSLIYELALTISNALTTTLNQIKPHCYYM